MKTAIAAMVLLLIGSTLGFYLAPRQMNHEAMEMGMRGELFVAEKNAMQHEMLSSGNYSCCLEVPCTYCIEKTPGHGQGPTCNCLKDVVEGKHPCGECIGEILEGHGNRFLAKYFAKAIAEEVGEEHTEILKQIIAAKYEISIETQN